MRTTAGYGGAPAVEPAICAPNATESAYRKGSRNATQSTAVTTVKPVRDVSLPATRRTLERGLAGFRRDAVTAAAGPGSSAIAGSSASAAGAGASSVANGSVRVALAAAGWGAVASGSTIAGRGAISGTGTGLNDSASASAAVDFSAAWSAPA